MSDSILGTASLSVSTTRAGVDGDASRRLAIRALLVVGCSLALWVAAALGNPGPFPQQDAELARLLRGMAVIKGFIVVAALAAIAWRVGMPITRRLAAVYLFGIWLMAGASMLIWQLTFIPGAAVAFHVGEFALLLAAWQDRAHLGPFAGRLRST